MKAQETSMKHYITWILAGAMVFGVLALQGMVLAQEGVWKTRNGIMPTERMLLSASVVDRVIYVMGGTLNVFDPTLATIGAVEAYNPLTDTWTKKADMPNPRWGMSTSVVNGKIYAIGGASGTSQIGLKTVEEYDPKTDTWTVKADMPTARFFLSAGVVDGIIYAIGGARNDWSGMPTVEAYDPMTDTWTKRADMPTPRELFSVGVVDGIIYAIGGAIRYPEAAGFGVDFNCTTAVDAYNPKTDQWTEKADATIARGVFSASAVGKTIYVIGGSLLRGADDYSGISAVEAYDTLTDEWRSMADMPTERPRIATGVVNGKIYVIGGAREFFAGGRKPFAFKTVEEFTPPESLITAVSPQGKLATVWAGIKSD